MVENRFSIDINVLRTKEKMKFIPFHNKNLQIPSIQS